MPPEENTQSTALCRNGGSVLLARCPLCDARLHFEDHEECPLCDCGFVDVDAAEFAAGQVQFESNDGHWDRLGGLTRMRAAVGLTQIRVMLMGAIMLPTPNKLLGPTAQVPHERVE